MATVTWTGAVSTTYSTDGNWDTGSKPTSSDDVIIANVTNDCVLTGSPTVNSWTVQSGARFNGNTETITVVGENSSGFAIDIDGEVVGTTTNFTVETPAATNIDLKATSGNVRHVTINHASCAAAIAGGFMTITGNLTITAGSLNTGGNDLTVTGTTTIGPASGAADQATLTCNASTVSLGSGITSSAYGLYVNQGGTFTGGSGTHTLGSVVVRNDAAAKCTLSSGVTTINGEHGGDGRAINIEGTSATFDDGNGTVTFTFAGTTKIALEGNSLYNVIVNDSSASVEYIGDTTIDNDLTVTAGKFRYNNFHDLTVTGNVSVTGILGHPTTTTTSNCTFGSLTINSGGEYKAPSGTTTITNETSGGFAINNDGTFTHNKGTVKIDYDTSTNLDLTGTGSVDLFNLIVDSDATVGYNASVIENNLTKLGSGLMRPTGDSGRNLTVKGTFLMQAGSFGRGANDTHTNTFGNIVVEGGELILTGGGGSGKTIVNGSFRNVGGTITSH